MTDSLPNCDLADNALTANAYFAEIDAKFLNRARPLVNLIGSKWPGELAIVGAAANVEFHAIVKRIRKKLIPIENLL
jgi:hypothetical protein